MKHKLLLLIVGAIGLIIGSAASGWVVFAHWEMRYSELYATTLQSEAQWLVLCGEGRHGRDWHQRLITLEKQALAVATEFPENPNTEPALRSVREVYEHAGSRPETAVFSNLGVNLRIFLCGVPQYASAQIPDFLNLARKLLVSASGTTPSPPEFLDGNMLADLSPIALRGFLMALLTE